MNSIKKAMEEEVENFSPKAYEFVLFPGEVLVWYPGWSHETFSIDDDNTALSMEFRLPVPIKFYEYYDDAFRLHSKKYNSYNWGEQGETCFELWKRRAEVLQVMAEGGFEDYLLCEQHTYDGDCEERYEGLVGKPPAEGFYKPSVVKEAEREEEERRRKMVWGGGLGGLAVVLFWVIVRSGSEGGGKEKKKKAE